MNADIILKFKVLYDIFQMSNLNQHIKKKHCKNDGWRNKAK